MKPSPGMPYLTAKSKRQASQNKQPCFRLKLSLAFNTSFGFRSRFLCNVNMIAAGGERVNAYLRCRVSAYAPPPAREWLRAKKLLRLREPGLSPRERPPAS